jgi:hypothetical protein
MMIIIIIINGILKSVKKLNGFSWLITESSGEGEGLAYTH